MTARALTIRETVAADLRVFFVYLNDHLADNGSGGTGFTQVGQIEDMFRIDGESLGYTFMARKIG